MRFSKYNMINKSTVLSATEVHPRHQERAAEASISRQIKRESIMFIQTFLCEEYSDSCEESKAITAISPLKLYCTYFYNDTNEVLSSSFKTRLYNLITRTLFSKTPQEFYCISNYHMEYRYLSKISLLSYRIMLANRNKPNYSVQ